MVEKIKTRFERIDERFGRTDGDEWMERLYADGRWTEGPAYFPAGRYLVFSDIPNDRVLRLGRDHRRGGCPTAARYGMATLQAR